MAFLLWLCITFLLILPCHLQTASDNMSMISTLPQVSLLALMYGARSPRTHPVQVTNSVLQQGSSALLAIRSLREHLGHVFNFTHQFLPGDDVGGPENELTLEADVENIISRFYFQSSQDTMALLSPCEFTNLFAWRKMHFHVQLRDNIEWKINGLPIERYYIFRIKPQPK